MDGVLPVYTKTCYIIILLCTSANHSWPFSERAEVGCRGVMPAIKSSQYAHRARLPVSLCYSAVVAFLEAELIIFFMLLILGIYGPLRIGSCSSPLVLVNGLHVLLLQHRNTKPKSGGAWIKRMEDYVFFILSDL